MKTFIAAVPLFNAEMAVEAYKLSYKDGRKPFGLSQNHTALDGAMHSPGIDILNKVGLEPFTGGSPIYVDLSPFQLLSDYLKTCVVPPELMACVFRRDLPAEQVYFDKIEELKTKGYQIAIRDIDFTHEMAPLFAMADAIMIDTARPYMDKLRNLRIRLPKIKAVLLNVTNQEVFKLTKRIPNALLTGPFYNEPLTVGETTVSTIKSNALHLLKLMGEEDFELDDASSIIQRDPALTISLLKFINSPAIGLSNKVNSIKQAVALLGQKETKKWTTAAVSIYLAADKPNEITKLSLTRARFAENLATTFEMGIHAPALFLTGLFSLLDVILDKPMEEALKEISVSDQIRKALLNEKSPFTDVLRLIRCYERADWSGVSYIMVLNEIKLESVNKAFIDSLLWYKMLLEDLV